MKQKNLAMLGVAIGCGLVAAVAVAKLSAGGSRGPETARVLVAKKDLPLQTKLDEKLLDDMLQWADMPKNLVPPDAATDLEQVKNKELNRTLKQGNPVSITDLGESASLVLPDGYKAYTVKLTQDAAVAGFAKPGARVDVIFTEHQNSGKSRVGTILKNMLVLALNTVHTLNEKTGASIPQVESVTLAVTDRQIPKLAAASDRGRLTLALLDKNKVDGRKPLGDEEVEWMNDPLDATSTAPPVAPPAPPKYETVVVSKKAVPLNTLINADNVNEFFATIEVKAAPQGAYTNVDDLKGKFVAKSIDEGTTLFKTLTADKAQEVTKPVDPVTMTPAATNPMTTAPAVVVEKKKPRFEQVIQEGGITKRVIWMEVSPEKWKRFDSEKEASEFKAETEEPKGDAPKTSTGE
jgi:Flp pilus assembly protein CpaB